MVYLRFLDLVVGVWFLFGLAGCQDKNHDPPDPPPGPSEIGKAHVWITTGDRSKLFNKEPDASIRDSIISHFPVITIDTTVLFQVIDGFGAALTGSSAYLLNQSMTAGKRLEILKDLFDPQDGIGISYLRLTMGASDFSLSDFTYDDMPPGQTDYDLVNFSLSQDLADIIPVLKEILQINPGVMIMASPWSPPAWMKTNGNLRGGRLKAECYDVYARYFARYIREMELHGIFISAVTAQNEPLHFTAGYPCMEMQAAEQADFTGNHLGPVFQAQGISTKIIAYDHNWDKPEYPIAVMNDPVAGQYIAGSAFHGYAGNVTAMNSVHFAHPDKGLYFTEISGGQWAVNFSDNLMWYMSNIMIGTVQNWSKSALFWNLVLDEYHGPQNNGCTNCRGVITWMTGSGSVIKNEEYYAIAHFSKVVRPGAFRLGFTRPPEIGNIGISAFLNTDGSKVLVAVNYGNASATFTVKQGGKYFNYMIPGLSVATFVW